jgi:hypothetical protein
MVRANIVYLNACSGTTILAAQLALRSKFGPIVPHPIAVAESLRSGAHGRPPTAPED